MDEETQKPPPNLVLVKAHEGKKKLAKKRDEAMDEAANQLYAESTSLLRDLMFFGDIDPDRLDDLPKEIPAAWVREVGVKAAEKRFRLCQEAWKPTSRVASGIMVAKHVFTTMNKTRSDAKRPKALNVNLIQMSQPPRLYPEIDVTEVGK